MRRLAAIAMLTGCLLVIQAGVVLAGGGFGGPCSGIGQGARIAMLDSCFHGTAHFMDAGDTLTVVNEGQLDHNLTAVDGGFATGDLTTGEAAEVTVGDEGIIRFYCTLHGTAQGDGMAGVLLVGEPTPGTAVVTGVTAQLEAVSEGMPSVLSEELASQGEALELALAELSRLGAAIDDQTVDVAWSLPVLAALVVGLLTGVGASVVARRKTEPSGNGPSSPPPATPGSVRAPIDIGG